MSTDIIINLGAALLCYKGKKFTTTPTKMRRPVPPKESASARKVFKGVGFRGYPMPYAP